MGGWLAAGTALAQAGVGIAGAMQARNNRPTRQYYGGSRTAQETAQAGTQLGIAGGQAAVGSVLGRGPIGVDQMTQIGTQAQQGLNTSQEAMDEYLRQAKYRVGNQQTSIEQLIDPWAAGQAAAAAGDEAMRGRLQANMAPARSLGGTAGARAAAIGNSQAVVDAQRVQTLEGARMDNNLLGARAGLITANQASRNNEINTLAQVEASRRQGAIQATGAANNIQAQYAGIGQQQLATYLGREATMSGQNMGAYNQFYNQNAQANANMMGSIGATANGLGATAQGSLAYQQGQPAQERGR